MKLKAYKYTLALATALVAAGPALAQDTTSVSEDRDTKTEWKESKDYHKVIKNTIKVQMKHLEIAMNDLKRNLNIGISNLNEMVGPELKNLGNTIRLSINDNISDAVIQSGGVSQKVKNYTKSYPMDANDRFRVDNKFGRVVVNTWNKPEVKVEVNIRSYADDDETAQRMIDAISISDSKNGDVVSFSTSYGKGGSVWNELFNNRNDHHKAEVNYTIYMPSKNGLEINNKYGNTEVPDFEGRVILDCAYGNVDAKALTHADNQVHIRYGSANVEALSTADIRVSYGNFDLGAADKINAEFHYSSARIGKVKSAASINAHYAGSVNIDELDRNFSSFSYSSSYSNLHVGVNNSSNADFDVTVRYGDFNYGGLPVEITQKTPSDDSKGWKPTKNFKGHIGKGSSERTINISSSYGGVSFD